jgi:hypothetical protein
VGDRHDRRRGSGGRRPAPVAVLVGAADLPAVPEPAALLERLGLEGGLGVRPLRVPDQPLGRAKALCEPRRADSLPPMKPCPAARRRLERRRRTAAAAVWPRLGGGRDERRERHQGSRRHPGRGMVPGGRTDLLINFGVSGRSRLRRCACALRSIRPKHATLIAQPPSRCRSEAHKGRRSQVGF